MDRRPILLIDDEETSRYVLRQFLGPAVGEVIEATDGEQGLERAQMERPRLIFLDLNLPRLNGVQVIRHLADDPQTAGIPVVVVTSSLIDDSSRAGLGHARHPVQGGTRPGTPVGTGSRTEPRRRHGQALP